MNIQRYGLQTCASVYGDASGCIKTHAPYRRLRHIPRKSHRRSPFSSHDPLRGRAEERRTDPVPRLDVLPPGEALALRYRIVLGHGAWSRARIEDYVASLTH